MAFLQRAFDFVLEPGGTFAYFVITVFALEAAFFIALGHRWRSGPASNAGRFAVAAGLAGAARGALALMAALGANGLFPAPALLAPLDRGITLLTAILLGWTLMFRPGHRWADFLAALAGVSAIVGYAVLAIAWYPIGSAGETYNGTLYEFIWQLAKLAVILISLVGLLIFRPLDWGLGVGLFLLLCAGTVYQLVAPIAGNYPASERIAEMAALPLFTVIVYRHALGAPAPPPPVITRAAPEIAFPPPVTTAVPSVKLTPQAASALAQIAVGSDENDFVKRVSEAVGRTLLADYTLLFAPPVSDDAMNCVSVFDLIREQHMPGFSLPTRQVSTIASAITRGRPARLRWDVHQQELSTIAQALTIPQFGSAIMVPFAEEDSGQNLGGIVVMSAFSQKEWSNEDHNLLASIAKPLARAFVDFNTKSKTTNELLSELDRAIRQAEAAEADSRAGRERAERLSVDLEQAHEEIRRQVQHIESLTAVIQAEAADAAAGAPAGAGVDGELQALYRRSLEELATLNDDLVITQGEIERLRTESAAVESAHAEAVTALNAQLLERQSLVDRLRQEVAEVEGRYGERFSALNTHVSEIQAVLDQLREDYDTAQASHEVTLTALQVDRDRAYEDLAQVRKQLEQLRHDQTRPLQPEVEELAAVRLQMEAAQAEARRQAEALAQVKGQLEEAQAALLRSLEDSAGENARLEKTQAELQGRTQQLHSVEGQLEQALKEIEQLKQVLTTGGDPASDDLADLQRQLSQARAEITSLRSQLQAAPTDAPAILRSQSQLLLSVVQDLRQPLSSIVGYTDLLLGESVGIIGALQRNFLERVKASAERMTNTIDDLIRVTAIDSGTLDLQEQDVEIVDVIEDAFTNVGTQFREKGISLRMDIADDIPAIAADRDSILQIISRLLTNACAASEPNTEVILTARTQADNAMLVSVHDTGGGIPERDLPRVFTRFHRADRPLIQGLGDTGVGLSIVKALAEAQGGRIAVESEAGVGSTFTVVLPTNGHQ